MKELDPTQLRAATDMSPIQLVLAGPGSGKTSTLTGRFCFLVEQGVDPSRILTLTFTKKAADEMKRRIVASLGVALDAGVSLTISTFHSFCLQKVLRADPSRCGVPASMKIYEKPEQKAVFLHRRMFWSENDDVLDIIGAAKERLLDASDYERSVEHLPVKDAKRKAAVYYRVYEEALEENGAIDFSDMVFRTVRCFERYPEFADLIVSAYDHVLVDEYQDVNPGQNKLIQEFVDRGVNLWAVGDDDQTLYGFRAASVDYILGFKQRHPDAIVHVLEHNYRSAPLIVDTAKRLIRRNLARCDKDFHAVSNVKAEIVVRGYPTSEMEGFMVAKAVRQLLTNGVSPSQIAVLYRTSSVGFGLVTHLSRLEIPFEVRGAIDLWRSRQARLVVGGLRYLVEGETPVVRSLVGDDWRADQLVAKLRGYRAFVSRDFGAGSLHVRRIVRDLIHSATPEREKQDWIASVDAIVDAVRDCTSIADIEKRIRDQTRALLARPEHAVVLSTIHAAKGLEWEAVFVAGMEDATLPHYLSDDVEEERRVAYVALTRAKKYLGLTFARQRFKEQMRPSRFLYDLCEAGDPHCPWRDSEKAEQCVPPLMLDEERDKIEKLTRPAASAKPASVRAKAEGAAAVKAGSAVRKKSETSQFVADLFDEIEKPVVASAPAVKVTTVGLLDQIRRNIRNGRPDREGLPWALKDDQTLHFYVGKNDSVEVLASTLKRSPNEVIERIRARRLLGEDEIAALSAKVA